MKVTFILPFLPGISFHPINMAKELGYFAEEGLDVTVEGFFEGSSFVVQQVAAGNVQYGLANADPEVIGFAQAPDYQVVYDFYNSNANELAVLEGSPVTSVEDLRGRRVGISAPGGGEALRLNILLAKAGLDPATDVEVIPLGFEPGVVINALVEGEVDAWQAPWEDFAATLALPLEREFDARLVCVTCDPESAAAASGIIANRTFIGEHPEAVVGVGRALAKATLFAEVNPDAALEVMRNVNPEEQEDPEFARRLLEGSLEIHAPRTPDRYGFSDPAAWQALVDDLLLPGTQSGLEEPIDVDELINNDFVDAYNDWDREAVRQQAEDF